MKPRISIDQNVGYCNNISHMYGPPIVDNHRRIEGQAQRSLGSTSTTAAASNVIFLLASNHHHGCKAVSCATAHGPRRCLYAQGC